MIRSKRPQKKHPTSKDGDKIAFTSSSSLIGLALASMTDQLRTKHNLGKNVKGVIVLKVDPASAAAEKGMKAGDIVVEIDHDAVTTVDDVSKIIDKAKKAGRKAVLFRLTDREGGLRFVAMSVQ